MLIEIGGGPLPPMRQELQLTPGRPEPSGALTWLIYDPVQHRYTKIDETTFELLSLWHEAHTVDDLADLVHARFGKSVATADIKKFIEFAERSFLLADLPVERRRALLAQAERGANAAGNRMLHGYLFFKVPLVRPAPFLRATLFFVRPLFGATAKAIVVGLGLVGLYLVSRQWDAFTSTFQFFFTAEGALAIAAVLFVVKALHELGHAYAATRHGCEVASMGVAFMVMAPMLYSDVTDAWRLRSRRARLEIGAAGVIVELGIACIATLAWVFLPDGFARSAAFLLATTGWIMSLAVNLNPLMRFDGYYLLSDLIGFENLQSRAFAVARWRLRELLFGFRDPAPEQLTAGMLRFLALYGLAVWLYRLSLFIAIAILVYAYFFKLLGIVLFVVEIVFFVLRPVVDELEEWYAMRHRIFSRPRAFIVGSALALLIVAAFVPWSTRVRVPVVVEARELQWLHAPGAATVLMVHAKEGQAVEPGDLIVSLSSPELDYQRRRVAAEIAATRLRLARRPADATDRDDGLVIERQLQSLLAKSAGFAEEARQLEVRAPFGGTLAELNQELVPGRTVGRREALALVKGGDGLVGRGYVPGEHRDRIRRGLVGRVVPDEAERASIGVTVADVGKTGAGSIEVPELASVHGGSIAVVVDEAKRLLPVGSQYLVTFDVAQAGKAPGRSYRGVAHLDGDAESFATGVWRQMLKVLVRESGV